MSKTLRAGRPSARQAVKTTLADVSVMVDCKRVNFDLSADQHAKLKIYVTKHGLTIKQVLTSFIEKLPE